MTEINLVQGDVVRSMTGTIVNCDHQKMLVFVNELSGQVGLVTINSRPYPKKGMETQLKICASDFAFLEHDSYVDCSSLFVRSVADFKSLMQNGQVCLIGNLDSDTMDKVVLAAADSRHLNALQKKFFDSAL
jgi:hypothetical protein